MDPEESAKPFHDWNERITKECYEANTHAPILNAKGEVIARVNNFSKISFDVGPTLLSWLRSKNPATYRAIIEADRESFLSHHGHGNAMAQVYNHLIMPLAARRDKITQVVWGIRDFEFHYRRKPEGMWLSETAVDYETLNILADHGILFTILSPHQAKRVRHIGFANPWDTTPHESVNPRHPYRILLERGRHFHVFFYDAPISRAIAFQGLLHSGDDLDHRLLNGFGRRHRKQLVSTATDGESFGHHHKHGEMAIAYGLKKIEDHRLARLTNFAEFLKWSGSDWEVDIHENSSWSCAHGVERWRANCGCHVHHEEGWNQEWRRPLRDAFDFLKKIADGVFEAETDPLLEDPWQTRNNYIEVILDPAKKERFLSEHARKSLNEEEKEKCCQLLEAQRCSLFMYTSCAWFFDDISGIEPVQIMKFALRAMELVQPYYKEEIEGRFLKILGQAKSNYPEQGSGADIFNRYVKAAKQFAKKELAHGL